MLLRPWLIFNPLIREQAKSALSTLRRLFKYRKQIKIGQQNQDPQKIKMGSSFGILSIAVDPAFQRCGVGEILEKDMERYALENGYDQIRLTVLPENTPAVKFYEKMGWEKNLSEGGWEGGMVKRLAP
jgi:ribosomal protein S18 acetylase RimI-like enzyme